VDFYFEKPMWRSNFAFMEFANKRILLKLSGESLMGSQQYGIDPEAAKSYAKEIKSVVDQNFELAIVIGGGNIFRGLNAEKSGIDRVQGDYMGMLATIINGLALQNAIELLGIPTRLMTAIEMNKVSEPYIRRKAMRHLQKGRVVIFGAGTGNPYFTTDTAAALRAIEINADVILKGTRVDGVYTADPELDPTAVKYEQLTFQTAIDKNLQVMDLTAFTMCKENKIPVMVFDINVPENLLKIVKGEKIGTLVQ